MVEGKHDFSTLFKRYTDYSYELFPKKESKIWKEPFLKLDLFEHEQEHEATFSKPIPTQLLDQLANEAKQEACKLNNIKINIKYRNFTSTNILIFIIMH